MARCLTAEGEFGNPASASHAFGDAAAALVETARAQVAASVGAAPPEVVWTSGATEANNLAIFGVAEYYGESGRHIVTARTEHKAVLDPCRELERRGWRVTYLAPDDGGLIHPGQVAAALQADTVLVSIMHVNNEIGVIQDIAAHRRDLRAARRRPAACGCGAKRRQVPHRFCESRRGSDVAVGAQGVRPEGRRRLAGVARRRRRGPRRRRRRESVQLRARQFGGGQERGLRAGTLATHQVVGMGLAFELAREALQVGTARLAPLRERLWQGLAALGGVLRNGDARAFGAAPAQCVIRGGGGRELAGGGAGTPGGVDRLCLHVGAARALVCACAPWAATTC